MRRYSFGAEREASATTFRLWAPAIEGVELVLEGLAAARTLPMERLGGGWHEARVPDAVPGTRYRFRVGDLLVPDPASRSQSGDAVGGASVVVGHDSYVWQQEGWRGRPWHEAIIYELNVGAFSPEGTYDGVRRRIPHFVELGLTAIELMPLADFSGSRNWGYDGVLPYAPDETYGTPDQLKQLIDEAHGSGLMVFLDVVYNHFGPEGNYLQAYAPGFFTDRFETPWGIAIDFSRREVRDFFIENAIYWLEQYRFDGLRFDAVHAIKDESPVHILTEIAQRVHAHFAESGRQIHLVLENDDNAARFLGVGNDRFVAQWNDDFHHACHVLLTSESAGYYAEYAERPLEQLGRILGEGFAWQGEYSPYRETERGEPAAHLPRGSFVNFLQNHDQIGNRAFGERIVSLTSPQALLAMLSVLYLQPSPPLVFMGEEWQSRRPYLFYCDFGGDLADAVREGRRREFARFAAFSDPQARSRIPDPLAVETFEASRLDWQERETLDHPRWEAETARLIRLRHRHVLPRRGSFERPQVEMPKPELLTVAWKPAGGGTWALVLNMGHQALPIERVPAGEIACVSRRGAAGDVQRGGRIPAMAAVWFAAGGTSIIAADVEPVLG